MYYNIHENHKKEIKCFVDIQQLLWNQRKMFSIVAFITGPSAPYWCHFKP